MWQSLHLKVNMEKNTFKLYNTPSGVLALLSDPSFENLSAVVNKQINITELRCYMQPGWF